MGERRQYPFRPPAGLLDRVEKFAAQERVSVNRALGQLVERGLDQGELPPVGGLKRVAVTKGFGVTSPRTRDVRPDPKVKP